MELTIQGRNINLPDRFRDHVEQKVVKFEELGDKVQRIEIKVEKENGNPGHEGMRVEATVIGRGPVVRAQAHGDDKFAAFDAAYVKLVEQLRRARDRRKVHHGTHTPASVREATSELPVLDHGQRPPQFEVGTEADLRQAEDEVFDQDYGLEAEVNPVEIRRKRFPAERMSADAAVDRMELLGHDFFLFIDEATDQASVAYRRSGWTYGVISLDAQLEHEQAEPARMYQAG